MSLPWKMLGLYSPVLILQAFCVYHAYKNNAEQKWYWFIILFPVIGCVLYLYDNFYSRQTVNSITETVKSINTSYRVEQLEKELRFADNITNRTRLADEYVRLQRYQDAIPLYQACLEGFMSDDPELRMKLVSTHFWNRDYSAAIDRARDLENEKSFRDSDARIAYAWSLHLSGDQASAQSIFEDMNRPFTNYRARVEYAKHLRQTNQLEKLKALLAEITEEFEHMKSPERRLYRDSIREIKEIYSR